MSAESEHIIYVVYVPSRHRKHTIQMRVPRVARFKHCAAERAPSHAVHMALEEVASDVLSGKVEAADGFIVRVVFVNESGEPLVPTGGLRSGAAMGTERLDALMFWLREQAKDGAHQPPSNHGELFTETADYIEAARRGYVDLHGALDAAGVEGNRDLWSRVEWLIAERDALRRELGLLDRPAVACGNRFGARVCTKRQGHWELHGDGNGGEWS